MPSLGAIARSWPAIVAASATPRGELPAPLAPTSWSRVRFFAPDAVERVGAWTVVPADDRDPLLTGLDAAAVLVARRGGDVAPRSAGLSLAVLATAAAGAVRWHRR